MHTTSTAPAQRCATRLRSRTARRQRESAPTAAGTRPQSAQSPRMEPLSGRALPDTQPDALSCRRVGRRSTPAVSAYVQSVLRARSPPRASLAESATDLARWLVWSGSERRALEDPAHSVRATLLSGGSPMQQEPAKHQPAEGEEKKSQRCTRGGHWHSGRIPIQGKGRQRERLVRACAPHARRARTPSRQSANPRLTARRCRGVQGIYHARRHVPPADVDVDVCDVRRATKCRRGMDVRATGVGECLSAFSDGWVGAQARKGRWSWRLDRRADGSVVCGLQPGRRAVVVARTHAEQSCGGRNYTADGNLSNRRDAFRPVPTPSSHRIPSRPLPSHQKIQQTDGRTKDRNGPSTDRVHRRVDRDRGITPTSTPTSLSIRRRHIRRLARGRDWPGSTDGWLAGWLAGTEGHGTGLETRVQLRRAGGPGSATATGGLCAWPTPPSTPQTNDDPAASARTTLRGRVFARTLALVSSTAVARAAESGIVDSSRALLAARHPGTRGGGVLVAGSDLPCWARKISALATVSRPLVGALSKTQEVQRKRHRHTSEGTTDLSTTESLIIAKRRGGQMQMQRHDPRSRRPQQHCIAPHHAEQHHRPKLALPNSARA
ncbi:hypothetical protein HETIRDRAFT_453795 [Heterobasidion irregulare TC 32-1]|uniref:Uncharacterized protein n=1 Tax=Heterobasidion irregulare (strain TC 32-1) TaxID=747525 RepID=W4K0P8_HETIT|nr:uncharacterized protein HETIRDRAFT_453795 [Heterobasidion irregulare TC 32-1]ETW79367.1 hypothetical protein HETIRDRAFT_453795 [Heterobasidion irregulare TC 32-1]